jgi:hypothetical protein
MEVKTPRYAGVEVDHPHIVSHIKSCAKQGLSKDFAQKTSGMPREVVERYYREVQDKK